MNVPPTMQIKKFPGGYVQNPKPGLVIPHGDFYRIQTTLDFKSLYPSLMRQFGLDYCNFRADSKEYDRLLDAYAVWNLTTDAAPIADKASAVAKRIKKCRDMHRVEQREKCEDELKVLENTARGFLKRAAATARQHLENHPIYHEALENLKRLKARKSLVVVEVDLQLHLDCFRNSDGGILPSLIERYMAERKRYKKLMKAAYKEYQAHAERGDKEKASAALKQHAQYDSAQLAVKIMVNSLFGFTGVSAEKGMFPLNIIAAATTCAGRWVIKKTAELSQSNHSVQGDGYTANFYTKKSEFEKAILDAEEINLRNAEEIALAMNQESTLEPCKENSSQSARAQHKENSSQSASDSQQESAGAQHKENSSQSAVRPPEEFARDSQQESARDSSKEFTRDRQQESAGVCGEVIPVFTEMIYGDTDSIMPSIEFKKPSRLEDRLVLEAMMEAETQRLNKELRQISKNMGYDRPHLILEFEKYGPMLVKGPKMYAIYKYEPGKKPKLSVSGLKPARYFSLSHIAFRFAFCIGFACLFLPRFALRFALRFAFGVGT